MIEFPGRDASIEVLLIDENKHTVSVYVTQDQSSSMAAFGIDLAAKLDNVTSYEIYNQLNRLITKAAFFNVNVIEVETIDELKKILEKSSGFAITNLKVGIDLEDDSKMIMEPLKTFEQTNFYGCMYKLGKFKNVELYVDPNMTFADMRCAIVENNFYNYVIDSSLSGKLLVSGTNTPKYEKISYFKSNPPKNTIIKITPKNTYL